MNKSERFQLRVYPAEKQLWKEAAKAEGLSTSAWIAAQANERIMLLRIPKA